MNEIPNRAIPQDGRRVFYSNSIKGSSALTVSKGCTWTALTTPSRGDRMLCSIFMASTTQTSSPEETRSPGRTKIDMTRPGMGERKMLSEDRAEDGPAVGVVGEGGGGALPVRPRLGGRRVG